VHVRKINKAVAATVLAVGLAAPSAGLAGAAPSGAPSGSVQSLLPTQADFPTGYTVRALTAKDQQDITDEVGAVVSQMKITPAQCDEKNLGPASKKSASDTRMVVAARALTNSSLVVGITPRPTDVAAFRASAVGPCSSVRAVVTDPSGKGGPITLNVDASPVSLANAPANSAVILVHTTGTVGTGSKARSITQDQLAGVAVVRGYTVEVQGAALDGGTPDRAAFAQIFNRAVAKVQNAA
jgi:hypothetical protein